MSIKARSSVERQGQADDGDVRGRDCDNGRHRLSGASRPPAPVVTGAETTGAEIADSAPEPPGALPPGVDLAPALSLAQLDIPDVEPTQAEETPARETVFVPGEWGRNPFLTLQEIAAIAPRPEPIFIDVLAPALPPPAIAPDLPTYTVSVILSGEDGAWAVVDSRLVRQGDRLGTENRGADQR